MVFEYFSIIVIEFFKPQFMVFFVLFQGGFNSSSLAQLGPYLRPPPVSAVTPSSGLQLFQETVIRDVPLLKKLPILLVHSGGSVRIEGWVQDRIKVTLKKKVLATHKEEAQLALNQTDLLTIENHRAFEIRIADSRGKDLLSKLRAQKNQKVAVDLEIRAPWSYALTLLLGEKTNFTLQDWKGPLVLEARNAEGLLRRLDLKSPMKISALGCKLDVLESLISGHILASSEAVLIKNSQFQDLLVDVTSGEVQLESAKGSIQIHTATGRVTGNQLQGRLSFQSDSGGLFLNKSYANIEAQSQKGQMVIEVEQDRPQLNLVSQSGEIQVTLKPTFYGILDLMSLKGDVVVQFPHDPIQEKFDLQYGPLLAGRVYSQVGRSAGGLIHSESQTGGIRVLRRQPEIKSK
jgi:hypothetical protein